MLVCDRLSCVYAGVCMVEPCVCWCVIWWSHVYAGVCMVKLCVCWCVIGGAVCMLVCDRLSCVYAGVCMVELCTCWCVIGGAVCMLVCDWLKALSIRLWWNLRRFSKCPRSERGSPTLARQPSSQVKPCCCLSVCYTLALLLVRSHRLPAK